MVDVPVVALLRSLSPGRWFDTPLNLTASTVGPALALVVITIIHPMRRVFGLFERVFLIATNVWFLLVAALLIARAHWRRSVDRQG